MTNEDSGRLRKIIKPPDYLIGNETINLENLRHTKNDSLSVKCVAEAHHNVFKNRYLQTGNFKKIRLRRAFLVNGYTTLRYTLIWLSSVCEPAGDTERTY